MSKPTPGRWGIFENGNEEEAAIVSYGDTARDIAYLKRENDQEWPEVEANAYLIAAAPFMRDVLRVVLDVYGKGEANDAILGGYMVRLVEDSLAASAPPPTAAAGAEDGV